MSRSRCRATRRRSYASPPCCRCWRPSAWSSTSRSTTSTIPTYVAADRAEALLTSPLGGLDAHDLRGLARALRSRDDATPSRELLRRAVTVPGFLDGVRGEAADRARRVVALVRLARERLDAGESPEQVLWTLWDGTDWGARLRHQTELGGQSARLAHRDLDAICALFDAAARSEEQAGHVGLRDFLDTLSAQEIPADTLAERGVRGEAVRLLTAHRSKGLEWDLVVVAHVQEGAWPDLRRRNTLLGADRIGRDGLVPPLTPAALLAEERRLFYVAATRARRRLVVTAVASPDDDGEQPSRFLHELGAGVPEHHQGRPRRPLSLAGLVAELRRTTADPSQPDDLRRAAAHRLAALALTEVRGRPLAPAADPSSWWGLRASSRAPTPVRPGDEPVRLSASALQGLITCPAQWFLQQEAGGTVVSSTAQGFGIIVHALADRVAKGELEPGPGLMTDLMALVDDVWDRMSFRTPWSGEREREAVRDALARFVAWQARPGARTQVTSEGRITATVVLPDGQQVRLIGYVDRLELDADGNVVVVDLKTGKYAPTDASLPDNPQLGLYQLAVDHGAVDETVGRPVRSGGAELVQLRLGGDLPKVQPQAPQVPDGDGVTTIQHQLMAAVRAVRDEEFVARPGAHCDRCDFHAICPAMSSGSVLS